MTSYEKKFKELREELIELCKEFGYPFEQAEPPDYVLYMADEIKRLRALKIEPGDD